jgi:hypothetical protein
MQVPPSSEVTDALSSILKTYIEVLKNPAKNNKKTVSKNIKKCK